MNVIPFLQSDPRPIHRTVERVFPEYPDFTGFLVGRLFDLKASPAATELLVRRLRKTLNGNDPPQSIDLTLGEDDPRGEFPLLATMCECYGRSLTDAVLELNLAMHLLCAKGWETFAEGMERQNSGITKNQIIPLGRLFIQCYGMLHGFQRSVDAEPRPASLRLPARV